MHISKSQFYGIPSNDRKCAVVTEVVSTFLLLHSRLDWTMLWRSSKLNTACYLVEA
jgi:hypothetical protein